MKLLKEIKYEIQFWIGLVTILFMIRKFDLIVIKELLEGRKFIKGIVRSADQSNGNIDKFLNDVFRKNPDLV